MPNVQPWSIFGAGGWGEKGKAGGRVGKAKSTGAPPETIALDKLVQVLSLLAVKLRSPPPIPRMEFNNKPNRIGSKLN